jgi:hypothetical protein
VNAHDVIRHIKNIVISTGFRRFVNPARIDPKYLTTYSGGSGDGPSRAILSTLAEPKLPALCYTVVFVKESHLHTPYSPQQNGTYLKNIIGKTFCCESDRVTATLLMALNQEEMKAQVDKDWLTYSCRPLKPSELLAICLTCVVVDSLVQLPPPSRPCLKQASLLPDPSLAQQWCAVLPLRLLLSTSSRVLPQKPCVSGITIFLYAFVWLTSLFIFSSFDLVCVLDGRNRGFKIDSDLLMLASKLPKFSAEIPYGSIAMVGYAASKWGDNNLSLSLNWVVVLATPSKKLSERD